VSTDLWPNWILKIDAPLAAAEVIGRPGSRATEHRYREVAGSASHSLNKLGRSELFTMPKIKPTAGPMRTQPVERVSTMPTPVLPMMPTVGKVGKTPQPKRTPPRIEAVRAAEAKITRRNSLRKQRDALKG
jgi:hypothetical protein